jgi:hypothetical protein
MNHFTYSAVGCVLLLLAMLLAVGGAADSKKDEGSGADKRQLFHVVSLKFKPGATKEQIELVEKSFAALKEKVPGITSLNWGTNVSPEKRDKGFTHCFVLTFASDKDRDAYLVHEDHKAFGQVLRPVMEDVMVIDFWAKQ